MQDVHMHNLKSIEFAFTKGKLQYNEEFTSVTTNDKHPQELWVYMLNHTCPQKLQQEDWSGCM